MSFSNFNNSIDRGFGVMSNLYDEFDRHFSHHHKFVNCFIPRFDLVEDARFYYLSGELPGMKAAGINIEPRDDRTLVIYGDVNHPSELSGAPLNREEDHQEKQEETASQVSSGDGKAANGDNPNTSTKPDSSTHGRVPLRHSNPCHHRNGRGRSDNRSNGSVDSEHGMLLNERLGGKFHRIFNFPMPIEEAAIEATVEDGILTLLIPKREGHAKKPVRRIPVV